MLRLFGEDFNVALELLKENISKMAEIIVDLRNKVVSYKLKVVNLVGNCSAVNDDANDKFPGFRAITIFKDYRNEREIAQLKEVNLNLGMARIRKGFSELRNTS